MHDALMCNTAALTAHAPHLAALDALGRELFLVALGAVDVMLLGDEALGANGVLAGAADEALLVPLPGLVLHLLHAGLEHVSTAVTASGELGVIAGAAVDAVRLARQNLKHSNHGHSYQPLTQTVCPRGWSCTCCRGSRPRASASPCSSGPWSRCR